MTWPAMVQEAVKPPPATGPTPAQEIRDLVAEVNRRIEILLTQNRKLRKRVKELERENRDLTSTRSVANMHVRNPTQETP